MTTPTANGSKSHGTARILVVDDDELIRLTARASLERAGYLVDEAADGNKALKQMARQRADLILLDVLMPEKEGIETLLQLRRDFAGVKIIAISGGGRKGLDDFLLIAERLGADAILKKPIRPQTLLATVASVLSNGVANKPGTEQSATG